MTAAGRRGGSAPAAPRKDVPRTGETVWGRHGSRARDGAGSSGAQTRGCGPAVRAAAQGPAGARDRLRPRSPGSGTRAALLSRSSPSAVEVGEGARRARVRDACAYNVA